ncbi:tyrosine-type recombinase/integrase [Sphingomonas sp. IC4-52]|uniref:tyrosine-type recombinase/integrase n=1 Tax=Sphingomonas sp. IC4-52 TaxID=2887202 RepID=UPI001D0F6F80|nr:tyrosine-type recombinase/integrase [Sphingomonas sp. IC4-52]
MWDNTRHDVKAAGGDIDDVGLHTLQHTCITRLALGEMELQRLSMWAGHSDVSITAKRYSHLSAQALAGGVEILGTAPTYGDNSQANPAMSAQRNVSVHGAKRANSGTVRFQ